MSSDEIVRIAQQILSRLPDGVPPPHRSVGPDGLNLFWVAGVREVEIEISPDLCVYTRAVNSGGMTVVNEEVPAEEVRLGDLSDVLAEIRDLASALVGYTGTEQQ